MKIKGYNRTLYVRPEYADVWERATAAAKAQGTNLSELLATLLLEEFPAPTAAPVKRGRKVADPAPVVTATRVATNETSPAATPVKRGRKAATPVVVEPAVAPKRRGRPPKVATV